jgi:Rho family protein
MKKDEDFLNPSIGTYLNDETGRNLKDLFLNNADLADIMFTAEGEI